MNSKSAPVVFIPDRSAIAIIESVLIPVSFLCIADALMVVVMEEINTSLYRKAAQILPKAVHILLNCIITRCCP